MPARIPSPGDSISITALSVSISISGSPLAIESPSFFSHEISLPVSWAISSAGITTLMAMVALVADGDAFLFGSGFDHFAHALIRTRFGFADRGQRAVDRHIVSASDEQVLGGKTRDDFVSGFGDHDFFLDARSAPAIGGGPECFERENHTGFDFARMFERDETADDRLLPDG